MIDHYGLAVPLPLAAHGSTSMTSRAVPSGRRPAVAESSECEMRRVTISATAVEPSASVVVGEYEDRSGKGSYWTCTGMRVGAAFGVRVTALGDGQC